jgi:hypothetical protein
MRNGIPRTLPRLAPAAPPGEYRVVLMSPSADSGDFEAELKKRALTAPRVTVVAGETREFEAVVPEK